MFGRKKGFSAARIDTLVGQGTRITGDLVFSGGLHVDGTIEGAHLQCHQVRTLQSSFAEIEAAGEQAIELFYENLVREYTPIYFLILSYLLHIAPSLLFS